MSCVHLYRSKCNNGVTTGYQAKCIDCNISYRKYAPSDISGCIYKARIASGQLTRAHRSPVWDKNSIIKNKLGGGGGGGGGYSPLFSIVHR